MDGTVTISRLTKHFGSVRAVDDLSFTVKPGTITGFLGPNGAGKTTTLRMLLGLVKPNSGTARIGGKAYAELDQPMHMVGAALEAASFHPGRRARDHLRVLCAASGVPESRADEVLAQVGLSEVGKRRVKGFSMGMRQRLGLAATLLGDPQVLILDEPANGLDPEGINWLRGFLRQLASEGRTVLISSHMLSEVQQTVDNVVIIAHGKLIRSGPLSELMSSTVHSVRVRSPQLADLRKALDQRKLRVEPDGQDGLLVHNSQPADVGRLAFANNIELHELTAATSDLEQIFLELTASEAGVR
ncbi:MAG: ABC transporter ATP-binding protein [Mycobacteriales bacterium]